MDLDHRSSKTVNFIRWQKGYDSITLFISTRGAFAASVHCVQVLVTLHVATVLNCTQTIHLQIFVFDIFLVKKVYMVVDRVLPGGVLKFVHVFT